MLSSIGYASAYLVVGVSLLILGFFVLDVLTPGKLLHLVWHERSINATILAVSGLIAQSLIVFTTIWVHGANGFGEALQYTIVFGVLGVIFQAVGFLVLDLLTPGKLGELVSQVAYHPASVLAAGAQFAIAIIVIASIA